MKALLKELKSASVRVDEARAQAVTKVLSHLHKMLSTAELDGVALSFTNFIREHSTEWQQLCGYSPVSMGSSNSSSTLPAVRLLDHRVEYDLVNGQPLKGKRHKPSVA